ncbi:hypothetical protein OS493_027228 [Desmophyllum pertusum]|uniref:Uncharacterized protein n=1 Tax=Desmophyllum pertusum TaxID=174260 RepID=A0A9X0D3J8_9CNID|nr:hypothetical protein OS493_027228 [Desmophyllum pertusum]
MDEAKTIRRQTTERILITSLPDTLKEMIAADSLEKFEHSSSGPKLPKDVSTGRRHTIHSSSGPKLPKDASTGRRHTIHVPSYYTSPVSDITDELTFLLKPRSESYAEPRRVGGSSIKEAYSEMETRQARFPVLQGAQLTLEPSAGKKINTLRKLNSCPDGKEWNITNVTSRLDLASENFEEGCVLHTKAANALQIPEVARAKLINLKLNQSDDTEYQRTKLSTEKMGQFYHAGGKSEAAERSNHKVEAMRTHVKKEDDGFNEMETKVARLFEWLQDQTDSDESR